MASVELRELNPVELWAVVKTHLSGKREIVETFDDFPSAYVAFMTRFAESSRLFSDDVLSFDIVHMIETSNK